jgi:uncharacterized membrane protein YoaK (UPF0700 family)
VGLAVCSGATDAITYLGLGKVFSAFMTGNVVFLALGLTGAGGPNPLRVAVALVGFGTGVGVSAKIVNPSSGSLVRSRRMSVALACAALVQAGFLAGWMASAGRPATGLGHVLTGISALAMGIQSGAVLSLGVRGVLTTAATASLVDLVGDLAGVAEAHNEWTRIAGVLVGICVGAAAGAALLVHARTYAPLLPLLGTVLVIVAAWRTQGRRAGL